MTVMAATSLALLVYGIGFAVSLFVAGLISVMSVLLHRFAPHEPAVRSGAA